MDPLENLRLHNKVRASRLMNIAKSDDYYTMRYVGHTICWYDDDNEVHKAINGLGTVGGNKTIVNASNSGYSDTVLHELSHNLGASHDTCNQDPGNCRLKSSTHNEWCDTCVAAIREHLGGQ